ncbi:unnamed protein product [Rotaria magnacalcarata]|uniref:Ubiquitin-like domain-containing protein n=1 Tax=Rotaria magnacalcarata TaxID=392030 RepID=A0A816ZCC6_9BILA|nr:unnamed protein product [Rotaria magnacalcarata]CAF2093987.1 unnamed protein product [Rotaria magnacalcarata]CAF2197625.1 unnamed protein product [Rotaria magnacalcarata]CAF3897110.1 unnamed protein product [Rotaria magnacalcarata]CAF4122449.1 unnamed protein product [Rotaria magnacalcarata]
MATIYEILKLVIRTVNSNYVDFSTELLSSLTAYDLKKHIELNHPAKPSPEHQRLIYSGKLLADENNLNQIFNNSNSESSVVIHLVLHLDQEEFIPISSQKSTEKSSSVSLHSIVYDQYVNALNQYQQQLQQFIANSNESSYIRNCETHNYLQYCYTHHELHQDYLVRQRPVTSDRSNRDNQTTNVPLTPPPMVNNNNEFNLQYDAFRTLQIVIEIVILSSVIYYYGTLDNFLLVLLILILAYLRRRGYFSIQRRQRIPPIIERRINEERQNPEDVQQEQSPSVGSHQAAPVVENQITTSRLVLTAVLTFFSSLFPERIQRN